MKGIIGFYNYGIEVDFIVSIVFFVELKDVYYEVEEVIESFIKVIGGF